MKNPERFIIYTLLALLLAVNLASVLGLTGVPASADPVATQQDLGPAGSLELVDPDDSKSNPLILRNKSGSLSWGDDKFRKAYSIAFVNIGDALSKMLQNDQLQEELAALNEEINQRDAELRERMIAMQEEFQDITPDDPKAEDAQIRAQALQQEIETWRQERARRMGALMSRQMEDCYKELVDAVNVVADRKHIDIVYRFIPVDRPFNTNDPDAAMTAIRLRTAIRYPEGLDITPEVLEELSLEAD